MSSSTTRPSIIIERLTPDSPALAHVADWLHGEWGHQEPDLDLAEHCQALRESCGDGGVPSVFVALAVGTTEHSARLTGESSVGEDSITRDMLVGTASLVDEDLAPRPWLSPWLASVYVLPAWRGRGIASALVRRVEQEARQAGIKRLYLFTPDRQALYRRLGWNELETLEFAGEQITVMVRGLDHQTDRQCPEPG
jgi:GNAT superfamily N-acetyltransferase